MSTSSIEMLRDMQMMNLKLMERSSKCVKDPNPLASTMVLMNRKYSLAIDTKLAKENKIPKRFLDCGSNGNSGVNDMHSHGRVLCKKEAIEWWINESKVPDQDTKEIINILYASSRKNVKDYYNIDWPNSKIKWGPQVMERRLVRTRVPIIEIPKYLREDAIKEILFSDFTLPNKLLTKHTLDKVRTVVNERTTSKMLLSKQVRV